MIFNDENESTRELLIGRSLVDVYGNKGTIISTEPNKTKSGCAVSIRFKDGTYVYDARFEPQTWLENSN